MIEIVVEPKPIYVPLYYQPLYKVSQILLILYYNVGIKKSASISFLHTIAWAMREEKNLIILLNYKNNQRNNLVGWCYEPIIERALIIAMINDYCERLKDGTIKLKIKGQEVVDLIIFNSLFDEERKILQEIGIIEPNLIDFNQNWEIK
jgi:hypothetical protein